MGIPQRQGNLLTAIRTRDQGSGKREICRAAAFEERKGLAAVDKGRGCMRGGDCDLAVAAAFDPVMVVVPSGTGGVEREVPSLARLAHCHVDVLEQNALAKIPVLVEAPRP